MVIYRQGSRALAFLQGVAGNVETILGYLDCIVGHHRRSIRHGFSHCAICLQNVRTRLASRSSTADLAVPISLVFCPS